MRFIALCAGHGLEDSLLRIWSDIPYLRAIVKYFDHEDT